MVHAEGLGGEPEPRWVAELRQEYGCVEADAPGGTRGGKRKPEGQHPLRKKPKGQPWQAMRQALRVHERGLRFRGVTRDFECMVDIEVMDMTAEHEHRNPRPRRNLAAPDPQWGSGAAGGGGRGDTCYWPCVVGALKEYNGTISTCVRSRVSKQATRIGKLTNS